MPGRPSQNHTFLVLVPEWLSCWENRSNDGLVDNALYRLHPVDPHIVDEF